MTTRPAPLAAGDVLAGKYKIERTLGEGGMGAVFLAENLDLGRKVAIKVLHTDLARDEALVKRFRQEARAAAAIGHPGIIDVLDLGTTADGGAFIVMEWLDGENARERLTHVGRLPVSEALALAADALDALAAAHAKGIVHRDLKPDNLFLVARPARAVKVLDFGISKLQGADDVSITRTGQVMGTPLYMSPEQARGARDIGPPTDLWSMGAILFHVLTGQPPFLGDSYNELIAKLITESPPSIAALRRGLPPRLVALIDALLDKDAGARPDAATARDELRAIARDLVHDSADALGATATPTASRRAPAAAALDATAASQPTIDATAASAVGRTTTPPTDAPRPPRRGALLALGAVTLLGAGGAVLWLTRTPAGAPPAPDARASSAPADARHAPPPDARPEPRPDARPEPTAVDAGPPAPVDAGAPTRRRPDAGPGPRAHPPDAGRADPDLGLDEDNPLRRPR